MTNVLDVLVFLTGIIFPWIPEADGGLYCQINVFLRIVASACGVIEAERPVVLLIRAPPIDPPSVIFPMPVGYKSDFIEDYPIST